MSDYILVTWMFVGEAYIASLLFFYLAYRGNKRKPKLTGMQIFLSSVFVAFITGITRMLAVFLFGGEGIVHLTDSNLTIFAIVFPAVYSIATYMYWDKKLTTSN